MRERLIFYLAKMIMEQIGEGYDYTVIKRVISVVITDFELILKSPAYHHIFRLYDRKHESEFSDLLEVNTLELPKLPKRKDKSKL
jgi:predicted transposase/invertase (TIGR01784 family)